MASNYDLHSPPVAEILLLLPNTDHFQQDEDTTQLML